MNSAHFDYESILPAYKKRVQKKLPAIYKAYKFSKIDLSFLISSSAVYSSNIEGNSIDLNTFLNQKLHKVKAKNQKDIEEIENLIKAYKFCCTKKLSPANFLKTHFMLSETLLPNSERGKYRKDRVGVFGARGLVYLAVEPEKVDHEMKIFWQKIAILLKKKLSLIETFYFASQIHLHFAHIHPFADGNGRAARLLEKWFLASKLGEKAWKISSEEFYFKNRPEYYSNINLGVNYYELDYGKALPFLLMMPKSLEL